MLDDVAGDRVDGPVQHEVERKVLVCFHLCRPDSLRFRVGYLVPGRVFGPDGLRFRVGYSVLGCLFRDFGPVQHGVERQVLICFHVFRPNGLRFRVGYSVFRVFILVFRFA